MTRAELERLDRDSLIARAETVGVARARILTRPELVDELLLRSATDAATKERARGLFGRARDLLARLVERGLNKPQAADRIRSVGRPAARPTAPAALPTVTLAEIYITQGYKERAIETLQGVLSVEPDHVAARTLLDRLRDAAFTIPAPRMPPENDQDDGRDHAAVAADPVLEAPAASSDPASAAQPSPAEPTYMLDDAPLPPRYDVDECVAIAVDRRTLYLYWEVREATLVGVRARWSEPVIAVRVVAVQPHWTGPAATVRDRDVSAHFGELFVDDLPPGSVVRVAVGVRSGAAFVPIAHCAPVEMPPSDPSPIPAAKSVRWTPQGTLQVDDGEDASPAMASALQRARKEAAFAWRRARPVAAPPTVALFGGSERLAGVDPSSR